MMTGKALLENKAMRRGEERVPLILKVMTKTNKKKSTKNKKRKKKDIKNDDTI